jgi:hypothetical protein
MNIVKTTRIKELEKNIASANSAIQQAVKSTEERTVSLQVMRIERDNIAIDAIDLEIPSAQKRYAELKVAIEDTTNVLANLQINEQSATRDLAGYLKEMELATVEAADRKIRSIARALAKMQSKVTKQTLTLTRSLLELQQVSRQAHKLALDHGVNPANVAWRHVVTKPMRLIQYLLGQYVRIKFDTDASVPAHLRQEFNQYILTDAGLGIAELANENKAISLRRSAERARYRDLERDVEIVEKEDIEIEG